MKPSASQKSENAAMSGFAKFGTLDQLDWLIVLLAVIVGNIGQAAPFSGSYRVVSGVGASIPPGRGRLQRAAEDRRFARSRPRTFEEERITERGNMQSLIQKTYDRRMC
jgi:hypothetical protein